MTMSFIHLLTISLCAHMLTCVTSTPVQRLCPVGQYLDETTGLCDHCTIICEMAHVQGTIDLCQTSCPDYQASKRSDVNSGIQTEKYQELCPPSTYLDEKTLRCESCALLCKEATLKTKQKDCTKKCPGFLEETNASDHNTPISILLWSLVAVLLAFFLTLVLVMVVKFSRFCSVRPSQSRFHGQRDIAPIILPYIRLDEEKPQQRVDQWLTLLHESPPETDSCYGSKASLIYNPVKTKT